MSNETAVVSENMFGEKLYQQRAREAMPLLVRQTFAREPIFYQQLADELGMPNPRNLNFVLGSIGQSLAELAAQWGDPVPPIQCLVINQSEGIPGEGFGWFMPQAQWRGLSARQRRAYVDLVMQQIYAYPQWSKVLAALKLEPARIEVSDLLDGASAFRAYGGGEGEAHLELKSYVRDTPSVIGLPGRCQGVVEKRIPSGDCIDVFFDTMQEWVGVEVKSHLSDEADITRGLFQCVKYKAVLAAMLAVEQREVAARAVLVLGGSLPERLRSLKHTLGVTVFENVKSPP